MAWERRDSDRLAFSTNFECEEYILENGKRLKFDEPANIEVTDISERGIGFYCDFPLKVGTNIIMNVKIDKDTTIAIEFVVRWVEQEEYRYRMGAMFAEKIEGPKCELRKLFGTKLN